MKQNGKTMYAQSSDIKSRTYLEYRRDMKKKAIAELEVLEWLEEKIKELNPSKQVKVYKSGGDKSLWFLRKGGISREPDFIAEIDNEKIEVEFQYCGGDIRKGYIFDFKTSKVAKKIRGRQDRIPKNIVFLYLFKEAPTKFAFIPAKWIIENGDEGIAPAWGNREVLKISGDKLLNIVQEDQNLQQIWNNINAKLLILDFQHKLVDINKEKLSHLLQGVIDEKRVVSVIPNDLDSFFKVCFILDNIGKIPQNANLWLVYLLSYVNDNIPLEDISKITYCVDFLYSRIELKQNELNQLVSKIKGLIETIKSFCKEDGSYQSSLKSSPIEETQRALFSINLLEDLIQDILFYYSDEDTVRELKPIKKIFENVEDVNKTWMLIRSSKR